MFRYLPGLFAVTCCFLSANPVQAQIFTVSVTHGQAEIGKSRDSYHAATVNSSYSIPAWGKTEDSSSMTIAFNPENRFRLLPNSEAQVTTGGEGDSPSRRRSSIGTAARADSRIPLASTHLELAGGIHPTGQGLTS